MIATGTTTSVRDFVRMAFNEVGIQLDFAGKGSDEVGTIASIDKDMFEETVGMECTLKVGDVRVRVDQFYYRPTEVDLLVGDATKAKEKLGWTPTRDVASLCKEMVKSDLELFQPYILRRQVFSWSLQMHSAFLQCLHQYESQMELACR